MKGWKQIQKDAKNPIPAPLAAGDLKLKAVVQTERAVAAAVGAVVQTEGAVAAVAAAAEC